MLLFILGLILFFGLHSISIINEPFRNRMAAKFGDVPWKIGYSVVSIIGFVLMVYGYGHYRYESTVLYVVSPWLTHLTMLLMLPVFPLLIATYFPGRISTYTRHPMLYATILWSFSHLLVNGRLIDVLLFGAFLVWAILDLVSMRSRVQRSLPEVPNFWGNDLIALVLGIALYGGFLGWWHSALIGVPVLG